MAAPRSELVAIKGYRDPRRRRCPNAIPTVPIRDINRCSGEQILSFRSEKDARPMHDCVYDLLSALFGHAKIALRS